MCCGGMMCGLLQNWSSESSFYYKCVWIPATTIATGILRESEWLILIAFVCTVGGARKENCYTFSRRQILSLSFSIASKHNSGIRNDDFMLTWNIILITRNTVNDGQRASTSAGRKGTPISGVFLVSHKDLQRLYWQICKVRNVGNKPIRTSHLPSSCSLSMLVFNRKRPSLVILATSFHNKN